MCIHARRSRGRRNSAKILKCWHAEKNSDTSVVRQEGGTLSKEEKKSKREGEGGRRIDGGGDGGRGRGVGEEPDTCRLRFNMCIEALGRHVLSIHADVEECHGIYVGIPIRLSNCCA